MEDLPFGVLGIRDGIPDYILEEDLKHSTSLLVDEAGDTLHTTTSSETSDSLFARMMISGGRKKEKKKSDRLSNALNIVSENLAMALCSSPAIP